MAKTVSTIKIPYEIDTSIKGSEKTLKDLKAIRSQMSAAGVKDSMFAQVDKDIETAEKALSQMLVQINKGFKNSKDVTNFSKQFDKFDTIISKIQVGLKGLNLSENFNFNTAEISKYNQQLDQLVKRQEQLENSYKSSIAQKAKDLNLTKDEISQITKEVKTQEELEEAVKKVAKAREAEAKKSISKQVQKSSAAQNYMSGATLKAEDLTYKAVSRRGAKAGTTDLRTKTSSGKVEDMTIDANKVQTTLNQEYAKALTEIANSGKSAAEGIEILQKAMKNYGVEITNTDKLQDSFQQDLDKIEQITYENADAGSKGAITKARKKMSLGQTNAQGQFELSEEGKGLANSQELQQLQSITSQLEDVTSKLTSSIEDGMNKSSQATENFNNRLEESRDNENNVSEAMDKGTAAAMEQAEAMEKTNATFDNLKSVITQVLSLTSAWNGLKRVIQETYNDVKNLDKAFASIAMVTNYSVDEMWGSYDQYADMAQKLGQSTQSVIEASALYYQQGLDTNDSLALTEETMKLATLAGLDFAEATSEMTAAIRGFNMEMNEGQRVTDVYSSLAAGAAAETEGIAYAMSKTASIASNAGMSFENTSAYLTKMIETTQEAPEQKLIA